MDHSKPFLSAIHSAVMATHRVNPGIEAWLGHSNLNYALERVLELAKAAIETASRSPQPKLYIDEYDRFGRKYEESINLVEELAKSVKCD
jgi:hypothetical protein